MSMFHVGVIKKHLEDNFTGLIDLTDYDKRPSAERTTAFLSRALAAYCLNVLGAVDKESAGKSITDGYGDNGIDGIHYNSFDKVLYLVQAKWSQDGTGSVDRGDFQKFLQGVRDLTIPRWNRFNEKIQQRKDEIEMALTDANTRFMLVLVYTGQSNVSNDIEEDVKSFLQEMNDASDFITFKSLKQSDVYNMIAKGAEGEPINLEVVLSNWGKVELPYTAYYGQVAASDVAVWWHQYYPRLFAPNIRLFLGDTEVNEGIATTLQTEPDKFWYYNNGITALCSTIKKKPIGGNSRDSGIFELENLQIVNGAQTAGAIARAYNSNQEQVEIAKVPIRFIELKDSPEDFDKEVTRNTNTQNRIDKRDFVSLDPQQERIREELLLHNIMYLNFRRPKQANMP